MAESIGYHAVTNRLASQTEIAEQDKHMGNRTVPIGVCVIRFPSVLRAASLARCCRDQLPTCEARLPNRSSHRGMALRSRAGEPQLSSVPPRSRDPDRWPRSWPVASRLGASRPRSTAWRTSHPLPPDHAAGWRTGPAHAASSARQSQPLLSPRPRSAPRKVLAVIGHSALQSAIPKPATLRRASRKPRPKRRGVLHPWRPPSM